MSRRRTPVPPELRFGPISAAEARAAGISSAVLQGPSFRRLSRGIYLVADQEPTLERRVSGLLRLMPPGTLVTGATALQLYGVAVGPSSPLHFCTASTYQTRRSDVRVSRVRRLPERCGILVAPELALVAAAPDLDLVELVTAGDWLIRLKRCRLEDLRATLAVATGRGCRTARRAGELIRAKVDSPQESRVRMLLVLCGLPEPTCNPLLGTEYRAIGHVDLAIRRYMIIIEYEGDQHRTEWRQWNTDIDRNEEFTAAGWIVIRVTGKAMRGARGVARRVYDALRQHGYTGPPPRFDPNWIRLFEQRK